MTKACRRELQACDAHAQTDRQTSVVDLHAGVTEYPPRVLA